MTLKCQLTTEVIIVPIKVPSQEFLSFQMHTSCVKNKQYYEVAELIFTSFQFITIFCVKMLLLNLYTCFVCVDNIYSTVDNISVVFVSQGFPLPLHIMIFRAIAQRSIQVKFKRWIISITILIRKLNVNFTHVNGVYIACSQKASFTDGSK